MMGGYRMCIGTIVRITLIGGMLALAGCQELDPYTRERYVATNRRQSRQPRGDGRQSTGSDPRSRLSGPTDTKEPTLAINRIWTDTPKTLLDPGGGSSSSGSSGSGSGSGSGSSGGSGSGSGSGAAVPDRREETEMPDDGGHKLPAHQRRGR